MWIQRRLFNKITHKPEFWLVWRFKMTQKIGPLGLIFYKPIEIAPIWAFKSSFMWIQWNLFKKIEKTYILTNFGSIWGRKGLNIWLIGNIFTHTWKYLQCVCKPSFMFSYWNFLRKWPTPSKISTFYIFFVIKDPLKKFKAKNQNCTSTTFWAILMCTFKPNIRKIWWKLRKPIWFETRQIWGIW